MISLNHTYVHILNKLLEYVVSLELSFLVRNYPRHSFVQFFSREAAMHLLPEQVPLTQATAIHCVCSCAFTGSTGYAGNTGYTHSVYVLIFITDLS